MELQDIMDSKIVVQNEEPLVYSARDLPAGATFDPAAAGDITKKDLYSMLLFPNTLVVVNATGKQIREALESGGSLYPSHDSPTTCGKCSLSRDIQK